MFRKILKFIRDWLDKMITTNDINRHFGVQIDVSDEMTRELEDWSKMYENDAGWLNAYVKSLNLPAAIAGEIARATTIEMEVAVTGGARADWLNEQINRIVPRLRQYVEYGSAKGGLVIKPYQNDSGVGIDFIQADQFYPVAFDDNGMITSCVFADTRRRGKYYYTRLEFHQFVDDTVEIKNMAFRGVSEHDLGAPVSLESIPEWENIEEEIAIAPVTAPLYGYYRFPLANNIDSNSPLGVSCYARAKDLIEQADVLWSSLMWEFESGERAVYADPDAFDRDDNGEAFLPNKRLYRTLNNIGEIGSGDLYKEWSPEFREASITSGLNAILKRIEFNCGLAYGTISDPNEIAKTATEIKASQQRTAATITDSQKSLKDALDQTLYAIDVLASLYNLAPRGEYEATYTFDDSIIVDSEAQFVQDNMALSNRTLSRYEWRMRNYGETEKVAKQRIAEIDAENRMGFFETEQTEQ